MFAQGLLVARGERQAAASGGVTYRLEPVKCGKRGCAGCPHGPYWYAYYREEGKQHKRYIGRRLPQEE